MVAQGNLAAQLKGRKLVSNQRYVGSVHEWHNGWGWISPLDEVAHAQIKRNKGLIYIHKSDVRPKVKIAVGTHLDFSLYSDARGLGAIDCCEVEAGAAEAAKTVSGEGEEALPLGWEKHWSAEHAEWFYWNKMTKETSWTRPTEAGEAPEDDEPLPAGWEKIFDSENQEWYFWHKATKKASWERPTVVETKDASGAKQAKQNSQADDAEAPVLGQQKVRGKVEEWQGFFGWITPAKALSKDLESLAERNQGKIYVNWRDVQPGLTMKAGLEVAFLLYADDNGLAASDVREPEDEDVEMTHGVQELAKAYFSETAVEKEATGKQSEVELEGPLLPGWEQYWSEDHQCFYYWHKATKMSSWERPCVPVAAEEEKPPPKVWEGEGTGSTARKATPVTPMVASAGSHLTPATPASRKPRVAAPQQDAEDDWGEEPPAARGGAKRPIPAWAGQAMKQQRQW